MNPNFEHLQDPKSWPGHKLELTLQSMSEDDAFAVRDALIDPDVPTLRIWRALDRAGYEVSRKTVARWRQSYFAQQDEVQA